MNKISLIHLRFLFEKNTQTLLFVLINVFHATLIVSEQFNFLHTHKNFVR
jgi:hypothetical protein